MVVSESPSSRTHMQSSRVGFGKPSLRSLLTLEALLPPDLTFPGPCYPAQTGRRAREIALGSASQLHGVSSVVEPDFLQTQVAMNSGKCECNFSTSPARRRKHEGWVKSNHISHMKVFVSCFLLSHILGDKLQLKVLVFCFCFFL